MSDPRPRAACHFFAGATCSLSFSAVAMASLALFFIAGGMLLAFVRIPQR